MIKPEKRSHTRKRATIRISCEVKAAGGFETTLMKAVVENISPGGAMIVAERPLGSGDVVMLRFKAGDTSVEVPAFAQVKWNRSADGKDRYMMGLEFLK